MKDFPYDFIWADNISHADLHNPELEKKIVSTARGP